KKKTTDTHTHTHTHTHAQEGQRESGTISNLTGPAAGGVPLGNAGQQYSQSSFGQQHSQGNIAQQHSQGNIAQLHSQGNIALLHSQGNAGQQYSQGNIAQQHSQGHAGQQNAQGNIAQQYPQGNTGQQPNGEVYEEWDHGQKWPADDAESEATIEEAEGLQTAHVWPANRRASIPGLLIGPCPGYEHLTSAQATELVRRVRNLAVNPETVYNDELYSARLEMAPNTERKVTQADIDLYELFSTRYAFKEHVEPSMAYSSPSPDDPRPEYRGSLYPSEGSFERYGSGEYSIENYPFPAKKKKKCTIM
ncbi:hypothetical protein DIPPA_11885, partial [Diplonema papillatum]